MRKIFFVCMLFALLSSFQLFSQTAADPLDFFYTDLLIWENIGLVGNLPAAKPYPLPLVKEILAQVIERGDSEQKRLAEAHSRRIFSRVLTWGGRSEIALDTYKSRKELSGALAFDVNYELDRLLSMSLAVDVWGTNKLFSEEILPQWDRSSKDTVEDNARVGPFWILPSVNSSVAIGSTAFYLNAGLMRGTWGPFADGVIVGSQALHSGQLNFVARKPSWTLNLSMYSLTANNAHQDSWQPDKHLSMHSFDFHPFDWFSVSILEGILYGGRFETMYLLPLSPYMISQGMTGFVDNSYLGGTFTVKPTPGLQIDGVLYADDLSFNDIIKFQFDTKWRLAGQIGIGYSPTSTGRFTRAALDYTMVTPYTYSHRTGTVNALDESNFQNYVHADDSFGASLDPNSDRLQLKIKLRPLEGIDLDLIGRMIRHGNVNQEMEFKRIKVYMTEENAYLTDGTINNHSYTPEGHAYNYSTPLLSQLTLQYIYQAGFDAVCRLPVLKTGGYMLFRLGYVFEINRNQGINNNIWYYTDEAFEGNDPANAVRSDSELEALAAEQYAQWLENATGVVFNNYIRAAFEYYY